MKLAKQLLEKHKDLNEEKMPKEGVVHWVSPYEYGIKMMIGHDKKANVLSVPEKAYKDMGSPKAKDKVRLTWEVIWGTAELMRADKIKK